MLSGDHDNVMGFGWAAANANIAVLLQEGGGGGTLGKAMSLHMASVLPTHSVHLICLDDQYDEDIYAANRIPVVGGSSPVPRGPGLGCKLAFVAWCRISRLLAGYLMHFRMSP
eukprot:COSAG02_NODE_13432_length_1396_cov_1.024672_2_plen_113_part_00